jgi:F420-0:gamma-glutamyl ligase-like protein
MKVVTQAIRTRYWRPGDDYHKIVLDAISEELQDGDVVAISEKALAVAQGRIVDESKARPGIVARNLADFWMRLVWGLFLSRLCHMKPSNIKRLRTYPLREGAKHKQVCLQHVGFLQALRPFSEGGIDTTNLPYSLASLSLESPKGVAEEIRKMIADRLGKNVALTIVDSDKTYSCGGIHLASRPIHVPGIVNLSFFAYVIGRAFSWRARSTPIVWVGPGLTAEYALRLAGLANKARGYGAGRTAWDMAVRFGVGLTEVDWEMLEQVEHRPLVILRLESSGPTSRLP